MQKHQVFNNSYTVLLLQTRGWAQFSNFEQNSQITKNQQNIFESAKISNHKKTESVQMPMISRNVFKKFELKYFEIFSNSYLISTKESIESVGIQISCPPPRLQITKLKMFITNLFCFKRKDYLWVIWIFGFMYYVTRYTYTSIYT